LTNELRPEKKHEAKLKDQLRATVKAIKTSHGKKRFGLEIKAEKLRHSLNWCTERNPEIMGKETPCILRKQEAIPLPSRAYTEFAEMIEELRQRRLIREKRL